MIMSALRPSKLEEFYKNLTELFRNRSNILLFSQKRILTFTSKLCKICAISLHCCNYTEACTNLHISIDFIYTSNTACYTISVCSNNAIKPVAVFGPQNPISDGAIRDQCALANIPHIQATWQPMDPDLELNEEDEEVESETEGEEDNKDSTFKKISINFYPDSEEIALAYGKLLKFYKWESFAALYEDNFGIKTNTSLFFKFRYDKHTPVILHLIKIRLTIYVCVRV